MASWWVQPLGARNALITGVTSPSTSIAKSHDVNVQLWFVSSDIGRLA
jgi:hypothetical protein